MRSTLLRVLFLVTAACLTVAGCSTDSGDTIVNSCSLKTDDPAAFSACVNDTVRGLATVDDSHTIGAILTCRNDSKDAASFSLCTTRVGKATQPLPLNNADDVRYSCDQETEDTAALAVCIEELSKTFAEPRPGLSGSLLATCRVRATNATALVQCMSLNGNYEED